MKYIFLIFFVFETINVKAADTLVTKFINSIYTQIIHSGESQYSLYTYGSIPNSPDGKPINFDFKKIKGVPKHIPFKDFKIAIAKDTSKINWNEYALKNVTIVDMDHIFCKYFSVKDVTSDAADSIERQHKERCKVIVRIKEGMNKHEIDSVEDKAINEYNKRPGMVEYPYFFSKPIFSKDGMYALLSVDTPVSGSTYVFQLKKNKWIKIFQFGFYNI